MSLAEAQEKLQGTGVSTIASSAHAALSQKTQITLLNPAGATSPPS